MVDIGALDRRIKALEYYVSFTLVETLTQKKVIPSSANSSIERFKFGFFVDGFNDYSYAETSNPQYNAAIVDGFLSPRVEEINLPMVPVSGGVTTSLPYIEKPFVLQFDATDGPVVVAPPPPPPPVPGTPTPPPPPPPPEPEVGNNDINTGTIVITPVTVQANTPTIVSRTISVIESEKNTLNSDSGIYYDEYLYTFSESAGSAEFFINSRDNNIGVIVYKSSTENGPFTTIVRNSGIDAQAITTPDINTHGLSVLNGGRGIEHPGSLEIKNYYFTGTSRWHEDQLKLLWQHNPDSGRYYMIRVYKGKKHGGIFGGQGKSGTYGFKLNYPADVSATETNFINGWSPTTGFDMSMFNGSWGFMGTADLAPIHFDFTGFNPASPGISPGDPGVIAAEQVFDIRITGLRPDTTHKFFIEGLDETAACKQEGRALGAGLRADSNGELRFNYYYYPTIQSLDVTSEAAAATEMVVSSKAVKIQNEDLSSISESIIQVQNYIKRVFNAPPQPAAIPSFGSEGAGSGSSDRIDNGPGGGGGGGRIDMNFEMVHWV
jgi:hypothetical protein